MRDDGKTQRVQSGSHGFSTNSPLYLDDYVT